MSKVGFVTMGESAGGDDIPTVGVGMLGYGFMGKAHSNAYKTLAYMTWPPPLMPQLVAIAGRNEEAVAGAARRYGFNDYVTDWKKLVSDDRIGYQGPLSVEWEDSGMDRDWGAPDALAFVRHTDFAPSTVAFDAAFARES